MQSTRPPGWNAPSSIDASSYMRPKSTLPGPPRASKRPRSQTVSVTVVMPTRAGWRKPTPAQEAEVLDHHASRIVDDVAGPEQAVGVERNEQQRLHHRAHDRRDRTQRPRRKCDFDDAEHFEKERPDARPEVGHGLDDLELVRLATEELAPQPLVEPYGCHRRANQPERW